MEDIEEEENFTSEQWMEKGIKEHAAGEFLDAIHCYNDAISLDPKNVSAWLHKALALEKLEYFPEALNCLDEASKLNPSNETNTQIQEYRDRVAIEQIEVKDKNLQDKITGLGKGSIFEVVGYISCVGALIALLVFFLGAFAGIVDFGTLIMSIILFIVGFAWFFVKNKFDLASSVISDLYEEWKEDKDRD